MVRPSRFKNNNTNSSTSINNSNNTPVTNEEVVEQPNDPQGAPPQDPQQNVRSTVNGPTSALTSFLKEQGIRPRHVNRFARRDDQPQGSTSTIPEEPNETSEQEAEPEEVEEDIDSDDLDADLSKPKGSSRGQSTSIKAGEPSKGNPETTSATTVTTATRQKEDPSTSDKRKRESPEPAMKPKAGKYADRKPGMIAICVECAKKFTVTRYTPSEQGRGQLCDTCAKGNPTQQDKEARAPPVKKRKTKKIQPFKASWTENFKTLQMSCISVIAEQIESIDPSLGHVSSVNMEKVCKIVCKHRELKPNNLPLFLDVSHTQLKLFDCINLHKDSLITLPNFCPHLQHLTLNFCGHLDGEVLTTYARRFSKLRELDLFGPYLVRREAWLELFSIWSQPTQRPALPDPATEESQAELDLALSPRGPEITVFRLKQSPRFNLECVKALGDTCKNLTDLRLDDIGLFNDQCLKILSEANFPNLKQLSIANAGILNGATGGILTDDGILQLLKSVGPNLEELDISQNKLLTDKILSDGLGTYCRKIRKLNLAELQQLTPKGVKELFDMWKKVRASKLESLNLSRCIRIDNDALLSILNHTGSDLKYLDLNSVDELRAEALEVLPKKAPNLVELDFSFVRDVDDFLIKDCLDKMPNLKSLFVYGNNRVSDLCPSRAGVSIRGQERAIVVV
ncbi:uncharacterized protein MELLADRAFT_78849 [Melampsora larici-populina 98AG31]|uniref:DNA repair protein rhp7 treble clef domain-containing protein n=1 Tax=Melampsora larici-populina (strain 98AG31 / pathotype 3-4-7) TaxID=747676 RepID=F4RZQ6_MELLP|nr:uncharacterized protein MELLADRAFT_78849 [Melampsora larici-populina 98AG31]EGG02145.1 hypothetical protein MELLADRAFT_78849 [Melampsora larici-populina 98AG31]